MSTKVDPDRPPPRSARELIETARSRIDEISCDEARRRLTAGAGAPLLIDVREELEHEMVRLGGSVNIPRGLLEIQIDHDHPDRSRPVLVYCSRGDRSALAAAALLDMGYHTVASIRGGLHEWRERGFPVVVPADQGTGSGI